jgi:hypothetical protein
MTVSSRMETEGDWIVRLRAFHEFFLRLFPFIKPNINNGPLNVPFTRTCFQKL